MPAVNPRIAVYLPRSTAAAVRRLAALRGVSRSAVIRDFLVEAEPVLLRIANLLDLAARTDRTALKEWAGTLEAAQGQLEGQATEAFATLDRMATAIEKQATKPAAAGQRTAGARRRRRTPGQ